MIMARNPNVSNPRWCQASVLLFAVAVFPLGFAVAQDFEAVEHRLAEGVLEGELTLQQAATMIDVLKGNQASRAREKHRWSRDREEHHGIEGHLRMVGERLKAAVKAGKMTEEEAWAKWHAIKEKDIAPRLKAAVADGHMSEEQSRGIWQGIEKAEIGERLKAAVAKGELTEEEARAKWEAMEKEWAAKECADKQCAREAGLEGHYKRMGISDEAFDRIQRHLHENGIQREQLDEVMGAMLRVIYQVKSEGDDFELDPRLRDYFTGELGLTDQQVELVQGMARRVAHRMRASQGQPYQEYASDREAIEKMVAKGEVSREDADRRLGEMRRAIDSRQGEKGVEPKFIPEEEYTRVEAELKQLVAEGKVSKLDADRRLRELQTANTKAHVEASVKAGKTTRAEADKLYKEFGFE